MKLTKLLYLTALISGLLFSANSHADDSTETRSGTLESYLKAIYLKKGFNGEILVAKGENILFQEAVGLASFEHNVEMKKGAKYRIASISKTFTATLIAIAQEQGKLNFRDKASDYINDLSPKFKDITIEQLLKHTSGLPHNEGIIDYWLTKSKLQMSPEQVINEINALHLLFKPGSKMSYSSLGYYLLSVIVETVYENNLQNILKEKILDKLQMTETGIVDNLKIIPQMASGYHLVTDDKLVVAPYRNYSLLKGAGDMYSTSSDLLKWNNSIFNNKLMNEKTKSTVFAQQTNSQNNVSYGFGWYINTEKLRKYYHGGGTWGYSTHIAMYPEKHISIIILSNISTLPISNIALDVEKIVFAQPFKMPTIEEVSKHDVNLEMYSGNFISETSTMVLVIKNVENSLYAQLGSNPPFEIYPKGQHKFFGKKIEIEMSFEINDDLISTVKAERMGKTFNFRKETK